MKVKYKILIGLGSAILILGIVFIIKKSMANSKKNNKRIILMGGLDTRAGDKNINQQIELVSKGLKNDNQVKGYRYTDLKGVLKAIEENKDSIVMLFSAGCQHAENVAKKILDTNGELSDLYIIEPYHSGGATTKSVQKAVELGVPAKNVFVGKSKETGLGVVDNTTPTPKCSPTHWCSLTEVAKLF